MQSSPMETPVSALLETVFTSILQVSLLCFAGYVVASRGVLDKKTQRQINRLNVSLFTPCLLFSKVAFFLSPKKLRKLWIIPVCFVLVTVVSMAVSAFLGWIFRLKRSQRNFAMAAAMIMNSNTLPIALMQSLVLTVPNLKWGKSDSEDAMMGRALSYLVLYSTLGMVLRWSYGVRLLSQADPETEVTRTFNGIDERSPLLSSFDEGYQINNGSLRAPSMAGDEDSANLFRNNDIQSPTVTLCLPPTRHHPKFYETFSGSPTLPKAKLPTPDCKKPIFAAGPTLSPSHTLDPDPDDSLPPSDPPVHIEHRFQLRGSALPPTDSQSLLYPSKGWIYRGWIVLNEFMTVPLWAALASLCVALVRPVQHALKSHFQSVMGAVQAAGDCSIPITLVVLGAYFYPSQENSEDRMGRNLIVQSSSSLMNNVRETSQFRRSLSVASVEEDKPGETKTVIIAIVSRMIITPMLLVPLMALSTKFDVQRVFEDPVFVVANVLLISSPPALTLAQITQAASGDAFERLLSRTIFWSYCIVTPPATVVFVIIGLVLAKL